jgi:hypothetical protein
MRNRAVWVIPIGQSQVYGSSFFFVEPQMNVDLPEEVFLAINPKGILIINPDSKEVRSTVRAMASYSYLHRR